MRPQQTQPVEPWRRGPSYTDPMGCVRCGASVADFFSSKGAMVCKRCFYGEQTALQMQRGIEHQREQAYFGQVLEAQSRLDKIRKLVGLPKARPIPGRTLKVGLLLIALGVAALAGFWFFIGDFWNEALGVIAIGAVTTFVGYSIRHEA